MRPLCEPILEELGIPLTDPRIPKLEPNLHLLKCGAIYDQHKWPVLIAHLCWPEETPFPEEAFLLPKEQLRHYKLAMEVIEEMYRDV